MISCLPGLGGCSHQRELGQSQLWSTMHSFLHTTQIPPASDVTCILLIQTGTEEEELSHAGLHRQLSTYHAQ